MALTPACTQSLNITAPDLSDDVAWVALYFETPNGPVATGFVRRTSERFGYAVAELDSPSAGWLLGYSERAFAGLRPPTEDSLRSSLIIPASSETALPPATWTGALNTSKPNALVFLESDTPASFTAPWFEPESSCPELVRVAAESFEVCGGLDVAVQISDTEILIGQSDQRFHVATISDLDAETPRLEIHQIKNPIGAEERPPASPDVCDQQKAADDAVKEAGGPDTAYTYFGIHGAALGDGEVFFGAGFGSIHRVPLEVLREAIEGRKVPPPVDTIETGGGGSMYRFQGQREFSGRGELFTSSFGGGVYRITRSSTGAYSTQVLQPDPQGSNNLATQGGLLFDEERRVLTAMHFKIPGIRFWELDGDEPGPMKMLEVVGEEGAALTDARVLDGFGPVAVGGTAGGRGLLTHEELTSDGEAEWVVLPAEPAHFRLQGIAPFRVGALVAGYSGLLAYWRPNTEPHWCAAPPNTLTEPARWLFPIAGTDLFVVLGSRTAVAASRSLSVPVTVVRVTP